MTGRPDAAACPSRAMRASTSAGIIALRWAGRSSRTMVMPSRDSVAITSSCWQSPHRKPNALTIEQVEVVAIHQRQQFVSIDGIGAVAIEGKLGRELPRIVPGRHGARVARPVGQESVMVGH